MRVVVSHHDGCEAGWSGMQTDVGRVCGCADREIAALRAEVEDLIRQVKELTGSMLQLEKGLEETRAQSERDIIYWRARAESAEADLRALAEALDHCESNRGVYSCAEPHDLRCPKSRAATAAEWKGVWQCECGREDLDAALARPGVVRVREEEKRRNER